MSQTVMITSTGAKVYISDRDVELAFAELMRLGFTPTEAAENSLTLVIGRAEAQELSVEALLYGQSDFPEELALLAKVNSLLASSKQTTI